MWGDIAPAQSKTIMQALLPGQFPWKRDGSVACCETVSLSLSMPSKTVLHRIIPIRDSCQMMGNHHFHGKKLNFFNKMNFFITFYVIQI